MREPAKELVLEIYDTVAAPHRWPSVLDKVSAEVNARGFILFELVAAESSRRISTLHNSSIFEPDLAGPYIETFRSLGFEEQELVDAMTSRGDGIAIIRDSEPFDDDGSLITRPSVQSLAMESVRHRAYGLLEKNSGQRARFCVLHSAEHGPLTADEAAILAQYLPHIAKALELGRPTAQLSASHNGLLAAMDRLSFGVCILNEDGVVIQSNQEFERQRLDYRAFRISPLGRLLLSDPLKQSRIEVMIADALVHSGQGERPKKEAITVRDPASDTSLCLEVAPLRLAPEANSAAFSGAMLYSLDASRPVEIDIHPVVELYGLTKTEGFLAGMLAHGMTNVQIAEERCRSVATINAQVKSLLAKTDCDNRTQFVRLLVGFGAEYIR
ncbi:MAG: helix-turn-helix transcriptional regulator [Pseudomonadota bacterium]